MPAAKVDDCENAFPAAVELTQILARHRDGSGSDDLLQSIYQDIHRIARGRRCGSAPGNTWQTTDLANEVFLRFLKNGKVRYQDRVSFLALAARVVRNLVIENARARQRQKRDPGGQRIPLDDGLVEYELRAIDLVGLDHALNKLAEIDPRAAQVVELRFFGDFTETEVARILGVSTRTVQREWSSARAFLHNQLR